MKFKQKIAYVALGGVFVIVGLLAMTSISLAQGDTWTRKADMPTPRGVLSTSVVDGIIYAIGGGTGVYSNLPTVEAYDPKTDTWTKKTNMPTPRACLSTCVVDGIIYAIGGGWSPDLSTVEAYDPVTDTWTKKTDMTTLRGTLSTSVVDGIIYAIGGASSWAPGTSAIRTVEAYNPATNTWTKKADMLTGSKYLSTSAVDGKIYAIGGIDDGGQALATVEEYAPSLAQGAPWTTKANMPAASTAFGTAVVNGKIYAIGGNLLAVEEYDPTTDTWTTKTPMPKARTDLAVSAVNGRIYAIGGSAYSGGPGLRTVEEYDPATDTWTTKADMQTGRLGLSTSVVNGKIYAVGGHEGPGGALVSTVEVYDPTTDTWTKARDLPTKRYALSTSAVGGKIYAVGGAPSPYEAPFSTVEEYDPVTDKWTKKADLPTAMMWLSTSALNGKIYAIGGSTAPVPFTAVSTLLEYDPASDLTSVEEASEATAVPTGYALSQNYPNPFNPQTTIEFSVPHSSYVTLKVFSLLGEEVATLASQNLAVGSYRVDWNARGVASGVYLYRLVAGSFVDTKKLLLIK